MKHLIYRTASCFRGHCLPFFVIFNIVFVQQARAQQHDEALKQRFLHEAPLQWEEYVRRSERLQGKFWYHTTRNNVNPLNDDHWEYKANAQGKRIVSTRKWISAGKQEYEEEAYGINPRYAFELRRKASTAPWVVVKLVDRSKEALPEKFHHLFGRDHAASITTFVSLDGDLLTNTVREPSFRVTRCRSIHRDGKELVEIVFSNPHKVNKKPPWNRVQSGTLLLDPNSFWTLRAADLKAEIESGNGTMKVQVKSVAHTSGSLPIPTVLEQKENWVFSPELVAKGFPSPLRIDERATIDLYEPASLPDDEEFTLTAFGLPEPPGLEWKGPRRWYLWVGLLGIACLVVGAGLRWRKPRGVAKT